jgi:alanyl-tRNA synthetase
MGLERTAAVLGGYKSVYDTDAFQPIIRKIESISGSYRYGSDDALDTATRIIADHIRTACFCIADGVLPGNSGRGYVLRRLIRRAVLKGQRVLGFDQPFFHRVYEGVVEAMGNHYTELNERREMIVETLKGEEALFRRTVQAGTELLNDWIARLQDNGQKVLGGADAFQLYDTFGFPLEVTREICTEAGIRVDEEGYEAALKEAQERSRGGSDRESVYGGVQVTIVAQIMGSEDQKPTPTEFLGYESTTTQTQISGAIHIPGEREPKDQNQWPLAIALKETPFYAESGGQIGDTGRLVGGGFEGRVTDVIKQDGVFIHEVEPVKMPFADPSKLTGISVEAEVDVDRRAKITRNHTATHLLHAALRQILGKHVTQAGSYVGPDRLRFDFTHGQALTENQRLEVEHLVNEKALENLPVVTYPNLPIAEAKAMGAMALFGEKYGDFVRLVQIGTEKPEDKSFSRELCGGIHVRTTGEIGLFKIVHEASVASGVRRIEALTGEGAYEWVLEQSRLLQTVAEKLKSTPKDLIQSIDKHLEAQRDLRQKLEKARSQGASQVESQTFEIGQIELAVQNLGQGEPQDASVAADRLVDGKQNRVALCAVTSEGKALFVCKVGPDAQKLGAHAGNLVRDVAKIAGGGGGGRPDFATAGGKDASKIAEALAAAESILRNATV